MAVMPRGLADLALIHQAAATVPNIEKIVLGIGSFGVPTRILPEKFGTCLSYTTPRGESDLDCAGPGQPDPVDLVDSYRFYEQTSSTRVFAVIGKLDYMPGTPELVNPALFRLGLDAVYVPLPTDSLPGFFRAADEIGIDHAAVARPFERQILPFLSERSEETNKIGACNMVIRRSIGWRGHNTAAASFSESLLRRLGRKNLRWKRVALIGAGSAALAVAEELHRLGARVCVLNRTELHAKEIAERYGFAWGGLDSRGIQLLDSYNSIIVNATSVGMEPNIAADPIELYRFKGREVVMDLVFRPKRTKMLERAEASGCSVISGMEMLERQAQKQFKAFTGLDFPV